MTPRRRDATWNANNGMVIKPPETLAGYHLRGIGSALVLP